MHAQSIDNPESLNTFKQDILAAGVMDGARHYRLKGGTHGYKFEMDYITQGSDLYDRWVEHLAARIHRLRIESGIGRIAVVSVANGMNRVTPDVALKIGKGCKPVLTQKSGPHAPIKLAHEAKESLQKYRPERVFVLEDVTKTGATAAEVVAQLHDADFEDVVVLSTIQRRLALSRLDALRTQYDSLLYIPTEDYMPSECRTFGPCSQGVPLEGATD